MILIADCGSTKIDWCLITEKDNKHMNEKILKNVSPWVWVPTLYFAEGIPYFIVNNISVLMLAKMGVPNGEMALFTSLLYLPWTIKPFWSPFVDIIKTKRWWVIAMQVLMSAAFILLTLTMPHPEEKATLRAEWRCPRPRT